MKVRNEVCIYSSKKQNVFDSFGKNPAVGLLTQDEHQIITNSLYIYGPRNLKK